MSLRNRLVIAIIFGVFLPWIGTYLVSNYYTKDVLEERAIHQTEDSLQMIEMGISQLLNDVMVASNYMQFNKELNQILYSYNAIDLNDPNKNSQIARHHINVSKQISNITNQLSPSYITILFENELFYTNYPISDYHPLEFYEQTWFPKLENPDFYQAYWIGTHSNYINSKKDEQPYLISMARTIRQYDYSTAFVIISINEKEIRDYLNKFNSGTGTKYYLTDRDGNIYSSLDEEEIETNFSYDLTGNEHHVVNYNNKDHFLVSYPVSHSDWLLVSLVPYQETIGNINVVTRTTIIIQGVFLLVFLIVLIVIVHELTKPLSDLNAVTKAVGDGDLAIRAKASGNNDIAKLSYSFNEMLDTIEEMIEQIKIQEEEKRVAELEMLQAQINPHFLFNVLNAIRLQTKLNGDKKSAKLIYALSSLLRMTINRNNPFITLADELLIVEHYTRLMNFRRQHELDLTIIVDEDARKVEVPRFFLQPIIENAVIHGYNDGNGVITIHGSIDNNKMLVLKVIDKGIGIPKGKFKILKDKIFNDKKPSNSKNSQSFNGIGIQNVYQRLKMIYGDQFTMQVESEENIGTSFTFHLPLERE